MVKFSRLGSMAVMVAAGAIASFDLSSDLSEPQRRILAIMPRGYADDRPRKYRKWGDRSKKQYLLKGVRP